MTTVLCCAENKNEESVCHAGGETGDAFLGVFCRPRELQQYATGLNHYARGGVSYEAKMSVVGLILTRQGLFIHRILVSV